MSKQNPRPISTQTLQDCPTKTSPIWEARKWRIAGAGTQNLRHWDPIWRRRGGARLRRAAHGWRKLRRAAQTAPGGVWSRTWAGPTSFGQIKTQKFEPRVGPVTRRKSRDETRSRREGAKSATFAQNSKILLSYLLVPCSKFSKRKINISIIIDFFWGGGGF